MKIELSTHTFNGDRPVTDVCMCTMTSECLTDAVMVLKRDGHWGGEATCLEHLGLVLEDIADT